MTHAGTDETKIVKVKELAFNRIQGRVVSVQMSHDYRYVASTGGRTGCNRQQVGGPHQQAVIASADEHQSRSAGPGWRQDCCGWRCSKSVSLQELARVLLLLLVVVVVVVVMVWWRPGGGGVAVMVVVVVVVVVLAAARQRWC